MSKSRTTAISIDINLEWPTMIDIRFINPVCARYACADMV